MKKKSLAFTMIELLTVMAIIAILAAILIPSLSAGRERSHRAYCQNNLSQIGKALMGYVHDNRDKLPPVSRTGSESAWDLDIMPYLNYQTNVFQCLSDPSRSEGDPSMRTYSANGGDASTNRTPFGGYSQTPPPLRFSDLDYNKGDIILIGERPGGRIGGYTCCGMDQIAATLHSKGEGGNYLMGSLAVLYLETTSVSNSSYWGLHTQ